MICPYIAQVQEHSHSLALDCSNVVGVGYLNLELAVGRECVGEFERECVSECV